MQKLKGVQILKVTMLVALGWGIAAASPLRGKGGSEATPAGGRAGVGPAGLEAKGAKEDGIPGEGVIVGGRVSGKGSAAVSGRGGSEATPDGGRAGAGLVTADGGKTGMGPVVYEGGKAGAGLVGPSKDALDWMNLDEAAGKLQKEQRPVLIDLYTSWCGWCKQMDKKTYSNKQVAQYLQEKFYPVKLDAETRAVINWKGKSYRFNADYKSNEFAVYLTHGQLEFPTTIIIPPGGEPQAIPGYMEPKELELLVKYFGEGKYNKVSFDVYQKSFKASW